MAANRIQLQTALQKPYDRILFGKEVLSPVFGSCFNLSSSVVPASVQPNQSEQAVIQSVSIYGTIHLEDGTEVTCYEIILQPSVRIEHSKVAIQRYVRKLLIAGQMALVNFIAPQNKKVWRLTLVAKDSELTEQGIKEKTTHAKRYTYLLGPSETCKTAAERFESLSTEKQITFQALVNAFSVEKLSKAFFDEYTLHYQKFCDYLQESNFRKSVFKITIPTNATKEEKDKACKPVRDFVKKLLGRIVFLYFVQKKGWLGASNTDYKDGMPDFIKQLFLQSGGNDAFYSTWLTKLFFETLNKERNNDDFKMPDGKKVKVPFLNGGLFDKEDFDDAILTIPAKLFYNSHFEDIPLSTKNKEHARGFLDFLDAFNFTVYEDSPDDHTVAVDPEMLGHIFENLLEDNKDKGAFYTPKEIVHYMCQESLTEYLTTHCRNHRFDGLTDFSEDKMRNFISYLVKNKELHPELVTFKSAESIDQVNQWFRQLDALLDKVKICDPAIGSGAFPMGLLQEIVAVKEVLHYELNQISEIPESEKSAIQTAAIKENIIQNSIYGVDIEKGAVDIARLRFWLSLVVDEEKPRALPNLDYKIVVGNSLVSKFEDEIIEIDWEIKEGTQTDIFGNENVLKRQELLKKITDKQQEYFHATDKQKLAAEIRNLKIDILINQLELMINTKGLEKKPTESGKKPAALMELWQQTQRWKNAIAKLQKLKQNKEAPFNHFDWKLDFPEVLNPYLVNGNGGFDIVIGNPPYIKEYTNKTAFDGFRNSPYYQGKMDIWYGIACKMLDFTKSNSGLQCFIAQNNWITSSGASKLRDKVLSETEIKLFTDFGNYKVFETAGIQTMVYMLRKKQPSKEYLVNYSLLKNDKINKSELVKFLNFKVLDENSEKFVFRLKSDDFKGKPFTFNNNVSSEILRQIKSKGNFYLKEKEVSNGIHPHYDFVSKKNAEKSNGRFKKGEGIFGLSDSEKRNLGLTKDELKLIKPYYTTEELGRYYANPKNSLWIIYTGSEFKNPKSMMPYPNLKRHLDRFKDVITSDNKPYGLHRAREEKFFKGESIVAQRKCPNRPSFTYTDFDCYVSATFYVIKTDRLDMKYLTSVLNSKLIEFWLRNKGKMQGNNFQIDKEPLLEIPIYKTDNVKPFKRFVEYIIFLKSQKFDYHCDQVMAAFFEQIIDGMVYELYFPELIKKQKTEIIQHLGELPEITDGMNDEQKMKICKTVFNRLNDNAHLVKINLEKMKREIKEIRIIEGLEN